MNQHVENALTQQDAVHEWMGHEGQTEATMVAVALESLTEATLAVAHEQKTANLLALMVATTDRNEANIMRANIELRLGIES